MVVRGRWNLATLVLTALVGAPFGCGSTPSDGARADWLRGVVLAEHDALLRRDPALAAQGLRRIGRSPHDFFRGTATVFVLDATTAGRPGAQASAFGASPAAVRVALVGDPHLENLGSFAPADMPGGQLAVDWNDFDGSTYGPFWLDVRRLALSVAVAGEQLGLGAEVRQRAVAAVSEGYDLEMAALARGEAPIVVTEDAPHGAIFADLLDKAATDGGAREELDDYTLVDGGTRRLRFGEVEPPVDGLPEDALAVVTPLERQLVAQLLAAYPPTLLFTLPPGALALKDVGRRLGAGVRSYALLRYYALVEGPTASSDDDWLLELKEVAAPMAYGELDVGAGRGFTGNGERQVRMQRLLQASATADPLLGWADVSPMGFKVRQRTKLQRGVDLLRIAERRGEAKWTDDDVIELARTAGRLLARAHGQARCADGVPGVQVIAPLLAGRGALLVDEVTPWALAYAEVVVADHALYLELLERHGDTLGFR